MSLALYLRLVSPAREEEVWYPTPLPTIGNCTKSLRDSSWLTAFVRGCAGVPGWIGGGTWCAGLISPLTCGREQRTL
jgi:hypothetical protein